MKENKFNMSKFGIICSITQIIISIICLIYNIVTKESYVIWIIMICSGICLLCFNISLKNTKNKKI